MLSTMDSNLVGLNFTDSPRSKNANVVLNDANGEEEQVFVDNFKDGTTSTALVFCFT